MLVCEVGNYLSVTAYVIVNLTRERFLSSGAGYRASFGKIPKLFAKKATAKAYLPMIHAWQKDAEFRKWKRVGEKDEIVVFEVRVALQYSPIL